MLKKFFLGFVFLLLNLPALSHAQSTTITNGLNWLKSSQDVSGSWNNGPSSSTAYFTTATVLESFSVLGDSSLSYINGLNWLSNEKAESTTYLAPRVKLTAASGVIPTADINTLLSYKNSDTGWGGYLNQASSNYHTAIALQALKPANYTDQTVIFGAIQYLLSAQNSDGGWGFVQDDPSTGSGQADSNIYVTAQVLSALAQYKTVYLAPQQFASAATFLLTNGGFATSAGSGQVSSTSNVYETALAFIALIESGQGQTQSLLNAITYLTTTQTANGSWNDDPYSTALALRALSYVKPDLAVLPTNIAVLPATPTVGSTLTVTATIANIGLESAANVTVRLLDNGVSAVDQSIATIAPGGTGQAVFTVSPLTPTGEHILTITVDPLNTITEASKANNSATSRIWARAPADLVVQPEYLTITPAYPKPGEPVTLAAAIANMGESDAGAFSADLYDGDPNNGGIKLNSFSSNGIAAGQWGNGSISFSLAAAGSHTLTLVVDPLHAVPELSTANNTAQKVVSVNATTGSGFIDLTIPMTGLSITPQRPRSGESVTVTLLAENLGSEAASADVELFDGNPAAGGVLLNKTTITLNAGESRTLTVPWQIPSGLRALYAYIDRANAVIERDKTNNSLSLAVMADMVDIEVSASDISITPEHPMAGDPATVKVVIQNRGIAPTGAFNVKLYNGEPNSGGTLLQTFPITDLAGDATRELSYPFSAARGTYRFYAVCDSEYQVTELHEDNNLAIRSLLVKTSAEAKGPDLAPLEFDLSGTTTDPQSLRISGTATVKFQNKGDDKVATPFRITVFEDRDGDGLYTEGTDLSLGYWDYATPMNPNMVGTVTINLAGTVTFRDAPIYAMLDSGQVVFEQNKGNNTIRKGSACENRPANPIEPVLKWKYPRTTDPTFGPISARPVVISLTDSNGDGRIDNNDAPAILVNASNYNTLDGKLWAFNGNTGDVIFSHYTVGQAPYAGGQPIVGDIDGDGKPDILIKNRYAEGIVAFNNDGTVKWDNSSQVTAFRLATPGQQIHIQEAALPALADLDGDGHPEIIYGATVVNWDGSMRCSPVYPKSGGLGWTNGFSYTVSVADLDMDGKQEIIAGNTAYNSDCSIKWFNTSLPDGLTAIGNFDDDPYPEIVLMSSTGTGQALSGPRVYLLDHNGTVKWGPIYISQFDGAPNSGYSGLPIIADFDGDGKPEIGVRGMNKLFILDMDGRLKKTLSTPSGLGVNYLSAPTVFDLDGDGIPEVLISSGGNFMIFSGKDGSLLYQGPTGFASYADPQDITIVDLAGNGHAEAVLYGTNSMGGSLRVYGAKNNDWVNTRRIWNQPSYHVTNINDDGSIPKNEAPSWLLNNNYRCQVPTSTGPSPYLASDLSASFVRVDMANYPVSASITVRVGNGGAKQAPAGIRTAFYNGDPAAAGVPIGSVFTTKALNYGEYEDLTLVWNAPGEGNHTILITTDADNSQLECDKTNNSVSLPVYITSGRPDLSIVADDIVAPASIPEGSLTDILVTVRNIGTLQADNILVRLHAGNPALGGRQIGGDQYVPTIAAGGSVTIRTTWNTLGAQGITYLYALVDPAATTADANRGNNTANRQVTVTAAVKPDLQIAADDIAITPAAPVEGATLTVTATVHNRGSQTGNIKVYLYDGNPTAGGIKRGETTIPQTISQGGTAQATFALDTIGLNGSHALYVRIDPDNSIDESDETNNLASRSVSIAAAGLSLSIATDKSAYSANENVRSTVSITELNGSARSLTHDLQILDAQGVLTASTPESALNLGPNASLNFGIPWNTATTYAGPYTLTVRIKENGQIIAKATAAIAITPVKTTDAKIVVDKTAYRANEQVAISATLTGTSPNYIFSDLNAKTSVLDSTGQVLFSTTRTIPSLANGQRIDLKNYWNTGSQAPGSYSAAIEISEAGAVVTTATQGIVIGSAIAPATVLKGTLTVDKQSLLAGETVNVACNLTNRGNVDLPNVALSILTVHVVNQTVYNTLTYQAALPMGAAYAASGQIDTTNFTAKDYLVILRANIGGVEETIAGSYFRVEGAPSAPALAGPVFGSDVATSTPRLSVNNASDPNDDQLTYEFELYADSGLTRLIASSVAVASGQAGITSWTVSAPLTENLTCSWRARAYDGRLYGPWMTPSTFRVNTNNDLPSAPTITNPVDGASVAVVTPLLTVNNASDPDSPNLTYNFDLALDPAFLQIVASTKGIPSGQGATSWQVPLALVENGWYYWRAQADDWLAEGPWSGVARFFVNTMNDAPTTPVLTAPANNSTVAALAADIVVANSTDPDSVNLSYLFEVDTLPTFDSANVIRSGNVAEQQGGTTLWHVAGLRDNTPYYVRAKASDGTTASPWSTVVGFFANTVNDPPTPPTLANPSNGAGVNLFRPTLAIHNSSDPDRDALTYDFELYGDAALTNLISNAIGLAETPQITSWMVPVALSENQTYYWRSRAFDGALQSAWMPTAAFMVNTANDAPGAPQLSAPTDGKSLTTLTPTLTVVNAVDPDSAALTYDFELYNGALLVDAITGVAEGVGGLTSVTLKNALADNTAYAWRVRAFDGDRYGAWMNMATFTTHMAQATITTQIEFEPQTLNKKSNGTWVNVKIGLPPGYRAADMDISSIRLEGRVPAELRPTSIQGKEDGETMLVKFRRGDVIAVIPTGNQVPVHVTGKIGSTAFEGMDIIRVIE